MMAIYVPLAILPGLLIAWQIYRMDKYNREPWQYLLICFALGMLVTFPPLKLEEWATNQGYDQPDHLGYLLLTAFVFVALGEELVKFMVLMLYAYPKKVFDEPLDGIVYAIMIGMGFATLENILYALRFGLPTTLVRALTAVPAHAIFAVFMGYYVGLSKFNPKKSRRLKIRGFFAAVLLHGAYDTFILQEMHEPLMVFATFTLLISGYFAWQLIRLHQSNSPFRGKERGRVESEE